MLKGFKDFILRGNVVDALRLEVLPNANHAGKVHGRDISERGRIRYPG